MTANSPEQLYDVVVFEVASRKVDHIAGRNLTDKGFHTVDRRLQTVAGRLNDNYDVEAVPAGRYKPGDILPEKP